MGYKIKAFQSNHEGALIDWLQEHTSEAAGAIINPGALTHYSYALHDCLVDTKLPIVEAHLSDIKNREEWRKKSVLAPACLAQIGGQKEQSYLEALKVLDQAIKKQSTQYPVGLPTGRGDFNPVGDFTKS